MENRKRCKQLNERHIKLYKKINEFIANKGYSPSYRELCTLMGTKSTSNIASLLDDLQDLEYLKHEAKIARSIKI